MVLDALAFVCDCVVVLGERAAVANPVSLVEVSISLAGSTNLPVKVRSSCWTIHTLFLPSVVYLMIRAEHALQLREVEEFRSVALDAIRTVPVGTSWTLASTADNHFAALAAHAIPHSQIPQLVNGTKRTLLAVEMRHGLGTGDALLEGNVVDVVLGTVLALAVGEVEETGVVALHADCSVEEESGVSALAVLQGGVVAAADRAVLAAAGRDVVEGRGGALLAAVVGEKGTVFGTGHAFVGRQVVDEFFGAGETGLLFVVEVFGQIAGNTGGSGVEGGFSGANAVLFEGVVVTLGGAELAAFDREVEVLLLGAGHTLFTIENGFVLRATETFLLGRVVVEVLVAVSAHFSLEIEVLRQKAGDALKIRLEGSGSRTLTAVGSSPKLLPLLTGLASLGGGVEVLGRRAGDAENRRDEVRSGWVALTQTLLRDISCAGEAVLAVSGGGVPELRGGTGGAAGAIVVGVLRGAGLALLAVDVVGLPAQTPPAGFADEVEVVGVVAFEAPFARVEEAHSLVALATLLL